MPTVTSTDQTRFQELLASDPEIQAVIRRVWGDTPVTQRPSNTPKQLEQANKAASDEIGRILKRRGVTLPDRTFINPRSQALEGAHGWAGLSTAAKVAIIAATAAGGVGAAGALGAFGGAAAAGAGGGAAAGGAATAALPTLAVTSGLPAALGAGGIGAVGLGAGAAGLAGAAGASALPSLTAASGLPAGLGAGGVGSVSGGGSLLSTLATNAGTSAAQSKLQGGSWKDALVSGGIGAATGGLSKGAGGTVPSTGGYKAALMAMLKDPETYAGIAGSVGSVLGKQEAGKAAGRAEQAQLQLSQDRSALDRYGIAQAAQDRAAQTDLQRKSFESSNRSATMKQALIGSLLGGGGFTPTQATASGSSGGLLRALNANPDALSALKTMGSQGSTAQRAPLTFQGGELLTPPALSNLPQIDNGGFLSTLARISELAGTVSPYLKKPASQPTSDYYMGGE